jgi:hypothetical protein
VSRNAYRNVRQAPRDLSSGRVLAPGEEVDAADLDLSDGSHDARLVAEGDLLDLDAPDAVDDSELRGEALDARGRELEIEGFSKLNADQKRAAVAEAERAAADENGGQS